MVGYSVASRDPTRVWLDTVLASTESNQDPGWIQCWLAVYPTRVWLDTVLASRVSNQGLVGYSAG